MVKLKIDGKDLDVEDGLTLLQACEAAGVEIPHFCYHERLSIAGNCRMCLVEVKGAPKLQASCAMSVNDLRPGPQGEPPEIITGSAKVKKAREGVMEFLLINHPLDCPICDQGGECDLQDQAMAYGVDRSRFWENKRAVEDKYIGPLVKTIMTRCIHCTRCVRFAAEIGGVEELGAIGRGEDMEVTTYLERAMTSELQGNVIDLCPVGALTSKPYAFKARPWELRKTETIDVMDAVGSNIRVDVRGREVMRIMPCLNEDVNEEWISDKTRFVWDGLKMQRLDRPYIRKAGRLHEASWRDAFDVIAERVEKTAPERMAALAGDLASTEEMFAFKDLMTRLGVASVDCRQDGSPLGEAGGRAGYLFNATIGGIEKADAVLLIGSNPRFEACLLNARIRKAWRRSAMPIGVIGKADAFTFGCQYLGAGAPTLKALKSGQIDFLDTLKRAERSLIIIGEGAFARLDGKSILAHSAELARQVGAIKDDWNGFCVLHSAAGRVGGLEVGCIPGENGKATREILHSTARGETEFVYLLGADEIDMCSLGTAFVIYQGSHGDAGAHRADVILPAAAYTEKPAIYVNTEGRPQMARRATFPPGDAREDWAILRALSAALGKTLPYDTLDRLRLAMYTKAPHLAELDEITPAPLAQLDELIAYAGPCEETPFTLAVEDFFLSNPIARASAGMAECSALRNAGARLDAAR